MKAFTIATLLILVFSATEAQVLFEGYSKVFVGKTHVGYTVQRYEFDPKKKIFTSISFLKTNPAGNSVTESLVAKADEAFQPLSFQYTTSVGAATKVIDASFKGNQMLALVKAGREVTRIRKDLNKGTFLSTFLGYVLLNNKISTGKKYSFEAVAEEDGAVFAGSAEVKRTETRSGIAVHVINHKFKDIEFTAYMTARGEVIGTESPLQKISTELVPSPELATKGMSVPDATLKLLFGSIPKGKTNAMASKAEPKSESKEK